LNQRVSNAPVSDFSRTQGNYGTRNHGGRGNVDLPRPYETTLTKRTKEGWKTCPDHRGESHLSMEVYEAEQKKCGKQEALGCSETESIEKIKKGVKRDQNGRRRERGSKKKPDARLGAEQATKKKSKGGETGAKKR